MTKKKPDFLRDLDTAIMDELTGGGIKGNAAGLVGTITQIKEIKQLCGLPFCGYMAKLETVRPPCIFSRDFDNVNEQEYTASIENCGNFIYVQGAADDDGSQPVTTVDGEGATGLDLVEVFCDATDIARKYQQASWGRLRHWKMQRALARRAILYMMITARRYIPQQGSRQA